MSAWVPEKPQMTAIENEMLGGGTPLRLDVVDDPFARDLFMGFESLGENCEFGLVQRRFGAETLGLLRWAFVHPGALIKLLETDFDGYGDIDKMNIIVADWGEIILRDTRYGMNRHTYILADGADTEAVLWSESRRLRYLVRKLLDDLRSGDKIFVFKSKYGPSANDLGRIHRAMLRHGPTRMLAVIPPDAPHPHLSTEQLADRLLVGRIACLGPTDGKWDIPFSAWLSLCAEARERMRHDG